MRRDKLKLSLVLPHEVCRGPVDAHTALSRAQAIYKSQDVAQVNIAATSGDMGILANHVPSIESLKPGVLEVIESSGGQSRKWFGARCGWTLDGVDRGQCPAASPASTLRTR